MKFGNQQKLGNKVELNWIVTRVNINPKDDRIVHHYNGDNVSTTEAINHLQSASLNARITISSTTN